MVGLGALAGARRGGLDARAIGGDGTRCPMRAREVGASARMRTKGVDGRIAVLTHRPPPVEAMGRGVGRGLRARRSRTEAGWWDGPTVLHSPAFENQKIKEH